MPVNRGRHVGSVCGGVHGMNGYDTDPRDYWTPQTLSFWFPWLSMIIVWELLILAFLPNAGFLPSLSSGFMCAFIYAISLGKFIGDAL